MPMDDSPQHPCPCCGYLTLTTSPPGSYQLCEICCWEDLPPGSRWPLTDLEARRRAQRNFIACGACDPELCDLARLPGPADRRVARWRPLDVLIEDARDATIQRIAEAFDGVAREDGVTIHEADVIDMYGSDEERAAARRRDTERRWQDVPDDVIERMPSALSFLDPLGFRYYIPAYMTWTLKHYETSNSFSVDSTIYAFLSHRGLEGYARARFTILDANQVKVICQFLRFMATYATDRIDEQAAQTALAQYWARYCDEIAGEDMQK